MLESLLYKRDLYLNKDFPIIVGKDIYEYDMHRAGFYITKEYKLLPDDTINKLEKLIYTKSKLSKEIGLIQRSNPTYKKALAEGFVDIRRRFFDANDLLDHEVLSIKKDAIFTMKSCDVLSFGEVSFSLKNHYTSYIHLKNYELYYNINGLDIKGINDTKLPIYKDYMISFLSKVFYKLENDTKESLLRFMKIYIDRYKRRELDIEFYRPFDGRGEYISKDGSTRYNTIGNELLDQVDITWNYLNVFIPLLVLIL